MPKVLAQPLAVAEGSLCSVTAELGTKLEL